MDAQNTKILFSDILSVAYNEKINVSRLHGELGPCIISQIIARLSCNDWLRLQSRVLPQGKKETSNHTQKLCTVPKEAFGKLARCSSDRHDVFDTLEEFTCRLYNQKKINDVDTARTEIFMQTYKLKAHESTLALNLSNYDACNLPPCKTELQQHLLRTQYISEVWSNAHKKCPTTSDPSNFGWYNNEGQLNFVWFTGNQLPDLADIILDDESSTPTEGGWAILRNWNIDEFDINSLLRTLQIKYGVSPYFKISVQPNPRQPGSSSITISPFGLGLPDRSYYYNNHYELIQNAYKQFIRDVLINLSVTTTEAKKFGEDMFNYEKRIAEITPHSHTLLNPVHTYNSVKISELKITAASLPLEDILIEMFPESNITEETEVIVTSLEYLTEISRIVTTTDKEIVNSYVMWTLVKQYVPYLSSQLTSTLNNFNSELLGFQKPIQPWEKCAKLIKDVMGFAVESSLELQNPITNSTKTTVENIFKKIRKTAQENLKNYPVSSELRKYLINKLQGLKLQVGLPDIKNDEHYIKDYYNKLYIIRTDFFSSAKNNFVFLRKLDEQLLMSKNFDLKMISQMIKYPQEVKYVPSSNTVIVPRSVLRQDEFENGYPISIMYGKLGIKIANAVISSILPYDSAWNFDLKLLSPFHVTVNESYNSINNQKKCLIDFLRNEMIISEEIAHLTSLSTLKHVIAVKIAYEALNLHLSDLPHIHQPSLERYEDSAIFFLTFAQEQCSISTELQELFNNYVQYELSQKLLLQVVWSQFPEFSNSFNCKRSDEKCSDMF